jgi:hypothetical protein
MFHILNLFRQKNNRQIGGGDGDGDEQIFKNIPLLNKIPEEFLFPLDAIETNIPIAKLIFDWSLFLSTIISVFTKLAAPFIKYIMKFGTDLFWTILGAIPLFGFDPIVSLLSIPMKFGFNLFIEFIVSLVKATPHLYKFIIQLSRKNFEDAINEFSQTTPLFTQLYIFTNKALPLLNNNLMFLTEYMPYIIKFAEPIAGIYLKSIHIFNNLLLSFISE